jgi:hypothetical protein
MIALHPKQQFVIGDDWVIAGRLTDEFGQPLDPTPATAITWKLDNEDDGNLITLTLGAGIAVGAIPNWPVPGVIITVPLAQTGALAPGMYRDQLRAVIAGRTSTFWQGPVEARATL